MLPVLKVVFVSSPHMDSRGREEGEGGETDSEEEEEGDEGEEVSMGAGPLE